MTESSHEPRSEQDEKLHRISNELYSATLTLRAVVCLLDQGEIQRARSAAAEMLVHIHGPDRMSTGTPTS